MKKVLVYVLAAIGGLTVLMVLVAVLSVVLRGKEPVPDRTILEVDFERGLVEYVPEDPFARIALKDTPTLRDVVEGLERGSTDPRVVAFVARIGASGLGMAQIQEVRDAVLAFRESGKPTVAYSETFGEFGPGNAAYYLATAFEEIHLQPSGDVGLTGLIAESPFLKGTLDKLGITPRLDHRKEYKAVKNLFTEREYTGPHREATERMIATIFGQMVNGIGDARGMAEQDVRELVDRGPFLAQEALDENMVDGLAYRDEVYKDLKAKAGKGARLLSLSSYLERAGTPHTGDRTIALIYGVGPIVRGKSQYDPALEGLALGSDTIARAFRASRRDREVEAILFRVDSPGGSYVASDAIWRETVLAREAGKPVIVSMGNVAGSGGYFVAMAANKIVAQPATLTGSIGVVAGKLVTSDFWEKLGLSWDEVHVGRNATMWTGTRDFDAEQWARLQTWLDWIYADFTHKVADGRGITEEAVADLAKGRVWTGEDARDLGLVDELGGMQTALELARESIGLAPDAPVRLKAFPERRSLFELVFQQDFGVGDTWGVTNSVVRLLSQAGHLARVAARLGLGYPPGVLTMPDVRVGE